jgi:hypothetical protein
MDAQPSGPPDIAKAADEGRENYIRANYKGPIICAYLVTICLHRRGCFVDGGSVESRLVRAIGV